MSNKEKNIEFDVSKKKFWKFWLIFLFINVAFAAIIIRLFVVQVVDTEGYKETAKKQHETQIKLDAQRGNIYDRNGNLLATNFKKISIAVDPTLLEHKEEICSVLANKLKQPKSYYLKKIKEAKGSFVWLARNRSYDLKKEFISFKDKGLILIEESQRKYPYGKFAAQLIGCTNIDDEGLTGIEKDLDSVLKGDNGYMMMYKDGLGRLRPSVELPVFEPSNGYSIELTIDIDLQAIVEYELEQGVERTGAKSGIVVAIKPKTGEILAMAASPGYHPETREGATSDRMRNTAFTDIYEPGSTFKIITASAALEERKVNENMLFNGYNGFRQFKTFSISDVHGLDKATFKEALEQSSNIIFSEVASLITDKKFYKYLRDFGFGLSYGFDMSGEVSGILPKPKYFNAATKRSLGFGYAVSVTALQLVNAYSAIANQGNLMKPHIIKCIKNNSGELVYEAKHEKIRRVISERTAKKVSELMVGVVENGSGKAARIKGINISGKTGTSKQLVNGKYSDIYYTASFAGFYPTEDPQIAVLVVLHRPSSSIYGGGTAAPIFKKIAQRWISSNPNDYIINDTREKRKARRDSITVPDIVGLNFDDADDLLENISLNIDAPSKEGNIVFQSPISGTRVRPGSAIKARSKQFQIDTANLETVELIGFSRKRALGILNGLGVKTTFQGKGKVKKLIWTRPKNKGLSCKVICG